MDAKVYVANFSEKIEPFIEDFFVEKKADASKINSVAVEALKNLQNYIYGGKKIRASLTCLGCQLTGERNRTKILPAAFAVELMHNSLLIHDDFVDNDETRRGKPTMHKVYLNKNGEHYAASMAIITADVAIFLANKILADLSFAPEKITKAISVFNQFLLNTGYGELMDIDFDYKTKVSWDDILKVRTYKTAYYTFVMPLTVGAVLGGASSKVISGLEQYGLNVGLAFQLRDDILGVFGDPEQTGKSNESDIKEGKKTLLYFKALELSGKRENFFLKNWYGKKDLDRKKIEKIKMIIKNSGALGYSNQKGKEFVKKGKRFIPKITSNPDMSETLSTFANYMISRDK